MLPNEKLGFTKMPSYVLGETIGLERWNFVDERGNKAAFKLLFPTVLCLMPAVYLFLLGPSIVAMSEFFTGSGSQSIRSTLDNVERLGRGQAP